MDSMDRMNLAARVLLGLGIAGGGTVGVGALGLMVVMMTVFAFDSPQRQLDPELALMAEYVGLGVGVLGTWVAGVAMPLPKRLMLVGLALGGLLFALGGLLTLAALAAALLLP